MITRTVTLFCIDPLRQKLYPNDICVSSSLAWLRQISLISVRIRLLIDLFFKLRRSWGMDATTTYQEIVQSFLVLLFDKITINTLKVNGLPCSAYVASVDDNTKREKAEWCRSQFIAKQQQQPLSRLLLHSFSLHCCILFSPIFLYFTRSYRLYFYGRTSQRSATTEKTILYPTASVLKSERRLHCHYGSQRSGWTSSFFITADGSSSASASLERAVLTIEERLELLLFGSSDLIGN